MEQATLCLVQYETPLKAWSVSRYDDDGKLVETKILRTKAHAMLDARLGQIEFGYDILEHDRSGAMIKQHEGLK